ncbi:unnamed protein product, partial [Ixodes hexagonus]
GALFGPCHGCTKVYRHVHSACVCVPPAPSLIFGPVLFRRLFPVLQRKRLQRARSRRPPTKKRPPDILAATVFALRKRHCVYVAGTCDGC